MASNAPHPSSIYKDSSLVSVDYQPPRYDPYDDHDEPFVPPKDTSSHHAEMADVPQSVRSPSPSSVYSSSTRANTLNAPGRVQSPYTPRPLSLIQENDDGYNPYQARDPKSVGMYDDDDRDSLVHNAAGMPMADKGVSREDLEYQDPYGKNGQFAPPQKPESALQRFFGGRYPIEQRIESKKRGIGRQRHPFLGT